MTRDEIHRLAREAGLHYITDREHRDRRERIATAALQGLIARNGDYRGLAQKAVAAADALIAELDKPKEGGA